ncbi:dihydroorotate dehydrogenase [Pseudorhodobacter sp. W20_MBD10_FR17]|uniref:dihydroorotate dehydrogenase n=1 Tax=Pseudorhodobacter sp. W20_MBD10_FR17 TaxID=3240266 RepID=UPI003F9E98A3
MDNSDLDDLFAAVRQQPVAVSDGLMARVLDDALAHQPATVAMVKPKRSKGFWMGLFAAIGGAGGLAGLSTAAIAGVWFGFAQPAALTTVTDSYWGTTETVSETVDILPGFYDYLGEG